MTPEAKVKAQLKEILNQVGAYHVWPVPTGYGSFMIDCYACHKGLFFGLECKATRKQKPTPLQQLALSKITNAGGIAFVVHADNMHEIREFFTA